MLENGRHLSMPLPFTEVMLKMLKAAKDDGHGQREVASVIETYCRLGGVTRE